mgnify:FL=1
MNSSRCVTRSREFWAADFNIWDSQVAFANQPAEAFVEYTKEETVDLVKDAFTSASERVSAYGSFCAEANLSSYSHCQVADHHSLSRCITRLSAICPQPQSSDILCFNVMQDIYTGDMVDIFVITEDGIEFEKFDIRKD